jgi:FkbM family methyltransferase
MSDKPLRERVFGAIPRSHLLYRLAQRYVDLWNGDQNVDMLTNGEQRVMQAFIPSSKVVFDVGANKGDWAKEALRLNPDIELHCFEPTSAAFALLEGELRKVGGSVHLNRVGLSSAPGETEAFLFGEGQGDNSLYLRKGLGYNAGHVQTKVEHVALDSLDAYCERLSVARIDFMKIDVEGHELAVLRGGSSLFKEHRIGLVQFEYGGTYVDSRALLLDCFEFLTERGYLLYKIFPGVLRSVPSYDERLESFRYSNWLAAPRHHPLDAQPLRW